MSNPCIFSQSMSTRLESTHIRLQVVRHYLIVLMRFCMALLFGAYATPNEMGEFITISFTCTFTWLLFDFGFKDRALQMPFQIDLSALKTLQTSIGIGLAATLFIIAFSNSTLSGNQVHYLLSYAIATVFVASSTTAYIKSYWEKEIALLAKTDLITHLFLQPIALVLLINGYVFAALICSFAMPYIVHSSIIIFKQQIAQSFKLKPLLTHWRPSFFLGLNLSLTQIKNKADTLLLASLSGSVFVGLYNRGYALPHHASQFMQAIIEPLFIPDLAQRKELDFTRFPAFMLLSALTTIPFYYLLHLGITTFWLDAWSTLLPALPFFIIWGLSQLVLGVHETILKSRQLNSYLVFRQILSIGVIFTCIFLYHSDISQLSFLIASCLSVLCLFESFFILYRRLDSSIFVPISVCVAFSLLLVGSFYL